MKTTKGREEVRSVKTFLAPWRPAGGVIRVAIPREADGSWRAFLCTDPEASAEAIVQASLDRWAVEQTFHDLEVVCYHGLPYIHEEMEGIRFRVGPKSFYQTNADQAYELYKITRDFAGLTGSELVYDLYTGTGTIAQFVAAKAKKVIGVEAVPEAIEDAKENARNNNITNTEFYVGDMKKVFTKEFIRQHGHPDVIITDPPRDGMHKDVVAQIIGILPQRIVYVSCNSATQARDLALLDEHYKITRTQAVDMFPQTFHVENVVCLERRV